MSGRSLKKTYLAGGRVVQAALRLRDGRLTGTLETDGEALDLDAGARRLGAHRLALEHGGRSVRATVLRDGDTVWVQVGGHGYELQIRERGAGGGPHAGTDDFAVSPMTGSVTKVAVAAGDRVSQGAELFVVEAMKMEYVVRAPRDVAVASVGYAAGDQVQQGDVVVTFEEAA